MTHDELVRKMIAAWFGAEEGVGPQVAKMTQEQRMSAVLRVCVEELLDDPSLEEISGTSQLMPGIRINQSVLKMFIRHRRVRYSSPKPKMPQEKREPIPDANFLDPGTNSRVAAEIVAELNLKEQAK